MEKMGDVINVDEEQVKRFPLQIDAFDLRIFLKTLADKTNAIVFDIDPSF
jgi:hypothetical protein